MKTFSNSSLREGDDERAKSIQGENSENTRPENLSMEMRLEAYRQKKKAEQSAKEVNFYQRQAH